MNKEFGKLERMRQAYENLAVPGEVDPVIVAALRRGGKEKRRIAGRRRMMRVAAGFALLVTAFAVTVNTVPAFADSMRGLPLVGDLVRILRLEQGTGSGGEITDGTQIGVGGIEQKGEKEIITLSFSQAGLPTETANYYEAEYSEYPASILFSIPGARGLSLEDIFPDIKNSNSVRDVYRLVTLDDSMERFVIVFEQPMDVEIKEYAGPARLELTLRSRTAERQSGLVYSLRSASQRFGESVGVIEEMLRYEAGGKDVRMLKDEAGTYCIEEGYYATEAEAETRRQELAEAGFTMYVESRGVTESPQAIKE